MTIKANSTFVYASVIVSTLLAGAAQAQIIGGSGQAIGGIGGAFSSGPRATSGAFGGGLAGSGQFGTDSFGASHLRRGALDRTQATANKVGSTAREDASMGRRAADTTKRRANGALSSTSAQANAFGNSTMNSTADSSASSSADTAFAIPSAPKVPAPQAASQGALTSGAHADRSIEALGAAGAGADYATRRNDSHAGGDGGTKASAGDSLTPQVAASGDASGDASVHRGRHGVPRANSSASANGSVSASR